jgi:hypothetical protein
LIGPVCRIARQTVLVVFRTFKGARTGAPFFIEGRQTTMSFKSRLISAIPWATLLAPVIVVGLMLSAVIAAWCGFIAIGSP